LVIELLLINSICELINELVIQCGGMWNDCVWMWNERSFHLIHNWIILKKTYTLNAYIVLTLAYGLT
jgi:hypothetical protein